MMASSVQCVCWEWERDDGGFSPYSPEESSLIEGAYSNKHSRYTLASGTRTIEFSSMVQQRKNTGFQRRIRRVLTQLPVTPQITAYWMWNESGSHFVLYNIESSVDIEMAFQSTAKYVDLSRCTSQTPYTIDFKGMEQMRHGFRTKRKIKRQALPTGTSLQSYLSVSSSVTPPTAAATSSAHYGTSTSGSAGFLNHHGGAILSSGFSNVPVCSSYPSAVKSGGVLSAPAMSVAHPVPVSLGSTTVYHNPLYAPAVRPHSVHPTVAPSLGIRHTLNPTVGHVSHPATGHTMYPTVGHTHLAAGHTTSCAAHASTSSSISSIPSHPLPPATHTSGLASGIISSSSNFGVGVHVSPPTAVKSGTAAKSYPPATHTSGLAGGINSSSNFSVGVSPPPTIKSGATAKSRGTKSSSSRSKSSHTHSTASPSATSRRGRPRSGKASSSGSRGRGRGRRGRGAAVGPPSVTTVGGSDNGAVGKDEELIRSYAKNVKKLKKKDDEACPICMNQLSECSGFEDEDDSPLPSTIPLVSPPPLNIYKLRKCGHMLHHSCLRIYMKNSPKSGFQCPTCKKSYGVKTGDMPDGRMDVRTQPYSLPGHSDCGTIEIVYNFSPGTFNGIRYRTNGFPRSCYLPNSAKGQKVLQLLKVAWERRLIFTIGTSVTTGATNTLVWNEIHHKTESTSNHSGHGYPDPNYLDNILLELAAQGVEDEEAGGGASGGGSEESDSDSASEHGNDVTQSDSDESL